MFISSDYPSEGLIGVKLYIKGKPEIVAIDDFLPFLSTSTLFGSRRSSDGDFWMSLLEKAFAKVNGNYEAIGAGWQSESYKILNSAPSRIYMSSTVTAASAWNIIADALNKNFLIGVDTSSA